MHPVCSVFILQLVFLCQWSSTFPLFPVEICPENVTEVETASERLNCSFGFDETKNEYHCVPLSNFTQLVEFCYPKTSGLIGKGLCMVLYGSTLDDRKCHQFQDGCPNKHYTSEDMYQFPACSQINKESNCYLADPLCPSLWNSSSTISPNKTGRNFNITTDGNTPNTTTDGNDPMDSNTTIYIILGICIALSPLVLAFAYFMLKRKQGQRKSDHNETRDEENFPLLESTEIEGGGKVEDYAKDDEFQKRFQQHLEEGSVNVCHTSQMIIVGENGVGKTTLLYRLQGRSQEEINQIKSTRGIDYHTEKSGFIVTNDQLTKKIGDDGDTTFYKSEKSHPMNTEEQVLPDERKSTREEPNTLQAKTDGDLKEIHPPASEMNKRDNCNEKPTTDESAKINAQANYTEGADVSGDHGKNLATRPMSAVKRRMAEEQNITMKLRSRNDAVLNTLDFAGQGAYYASHQAHMRKGAIYIIVFDASRSLSKRKIYRMSADGMADQDPTASGENICLCDRPYTSFSRWSQSDYIDYWLNTIRVHGGSCDNIILVGTHKDKVTNWKDIKSELDKIVNKNAQLLPKKRCAFFIDLSRMNGDDEKELGNIKDYICKVVSKSERNPVPAKWMKFEAVFEIIKSEMPVIGIDDLLEIIDQMETEMWDVEIHDMLRYFHDTRRIIFFNMDRLREIIIVDIQWFYDCFKHIITDKEHITEENGIVDTEVEDIFLKTSLLDSNLYKRLLNVKASNVPLEHREILGEYQQKLGMMLYIEGFKISDDKKIDGWYVPSVNTEEFQPDIEKYKDSKASSILCFRFEDYLPLDLFGRIIVLCLSSRKWSSVRRRLYKDGAHLLYCGADENNDDPLEVYLSTTRKIITVQILNVPKPEQQRKRVIPRRKQGGVVKTEIQSVIQELLGHFYLCSNNYEIGFLCSKEKGYKESSVNHFINSKEKYCHACDNLVVDEMTQDTDFWNVSSREELNSNNKDKGERRGQRQWLATCCQIYLKVQEQILSEKEPESQEPDDKKENVPDKEFGTFYISQLTKMDSIATTAKDSHLSKDQMEKLERLESFVDIGLKLKHLCSIFRTSNGIKEINIAEIKDIACTLKKISFAFDDKGRHVRRNLFLSWTDIVEDIAYEDIETIPEIYLPVPNPKFGADVKLEASVDAGESHFIWLKVDDTKNRFKILKPGKPTSGLMDLLHLTKFSEDDIGHYQLIVATKRTVGRKAFQLQDLQSLSVEAEVVTRDIGVNNTCSMGIRENIDTSRQQLDALNEEYVRIKVVEEPPGAYPHILESAPLIATVPAQEPSIPSMYSTSSTLASEAKSKDPEPDLKRRIQELTCKELELKTQYLEIKIEKHRNKRNIHMIVVVFFLSLILYFVVITLPLFILLV